MYGVWANLFRLFPTQHTFAQQVTQLAKQEKELEDANAALACIVICLLQPCYGRNDVICPFL